MVRKALVVEDDLDTLSSLVQILESDGCVVDSASDGDRAVRCLARQDYNIVLLDLGLPRVSGDDIMEHIAATSPALLSRLIIVTGSDIERVRTLFPEVCDALAKPVVPGDLLTAVHRCAR